MVEKKGGSDLRIDLGGFESLLDDGSLFRTPGKEDDLLRGGKDCVDPHRDCALWHVFFTAKAGGSVRDCLVVKFNDSCLRILLNERMNW